MRNPKVAVIGASGSELAQIKIILAEKNIDLVDIPDDADAVVDTDWVLGHKMPESVDLPEAAECCTDSSYDDGAQHWRGGSRGKGGKIKYTRN